MEISKAVLGDLGGICKLSFQINTTSFQHAPNVFTHPSRIGSDEKFWKDQLEINNSIVYVAKFEGTVIGFITAKITQNLDVSFLSTNKICRIGTIVVSENHQSKGIGKMLMEYAEKWAKDAGALEIRLEVMEFNKSGQRFYETLGYDIQSRILAKPIAQQRLRADSSRHFSDTSPTLPRHFVFPFGGICDVLPFDGGSSTCFPRRDQKRARECLMKMM